MQKWYDDYNSLMKLGLQKEILTQSPDTGLYIVDSVTSSDGLETPSALARDWFKMALSHMCYTMSMVYQSSAGGAEQTSLLWNLLNNNLKDKKYKKATANQIAERECEEAEYNESYAEVIVKHPDFKTWLYDHLDRQIDPFSSFDSFTTYLGKTPADLYEEFPETMEIQPNISEDERLFGDIIMIIMMKTHLQSAVGVTKDEVWECLQGYSKTDWYSRATWKLRNNIITYIGEELNIEKPARPPSRVSTEISYKGCKCTGYSAFTLASADKPFYYIRYAYRVLLHGICTTRSADVDRCLEFLHSKNRMADLKMWDAFCEHSHYQDGNIHPWSSTFVRVLRLFNTIVLFFKVEDAPEDVKAFFLCPDYATLPRLETKYCIFTGYCSRSPLFSRFFVRV